MVNFKLGETNVKVKWLACHERGTIKKSDRIRTYDLPNTGRALYPLELRRTHFWLKTREQGIESQMTSTEVVQKPEVKLLGVTLDKQLRFTTQVIDVCRKVSSLVGVISRWRKLIPSSGKLQIFKSAMLPHLTYCQMIWHFCCASEAWELETL